MHTLRRFKATIMGDDTSLASITSQLALGGVPISEADCRSCGEPCGEGHEPYPSRFDVDMETQMLGSVKPYHRQIVISTGKTDWDRDIATMKGSLAASLESVDQTPSTSISSMSATSQKPPPGVFNSADTTKLTVLNGSHRTISEDADEDTVLVFPDYKMVSGVPRTVEGAKKLWDGWLDPGVSHSSLSKTDGRAMKTWVIPYSCVILLCSHKRRDNRCHIAAEKLLHTFTHSLENAGYTVDTDLDHPATDPLEDTQEVEQEMTKQYREQWESKKVLILRNSHTGGHKFAGNCIIYTPHQYGIWYGRVTTHDVDAIVSNTIEKGLVLPSLLRGGVNLTRTNEGKGRKCSLNDW